MEIKNCLIKTKCDVQGCKNLADYCIFSNEKNVLNLCKNCSKNIYEVLGKVNVPKAITPPFKKQKKLR